MKTKKWKPRLIIAKETPWVYEGYSIMQGDIEIAHLNTYHFDVNNNGRILSAAQKLLAVAKKAEMFYREELDAIGPCDHEVNICVCGIIQELADLQAVIANAERR